MVIDAECEHCEHTFSLGGDFACAIIATDCPNCGKQTRVCNNCPELLNGIVACDNCPYEPENK